MLTFDDGIVKILNKINVSPKGKKPKYDLQEMCEHYFEFETVGINRYFIALAEKSKIDTVIKIWENKNITTDNIAQLEDGINYRIVQVQHAVEDGIKISRLSLERIH